MEASVPFQPSQFEPIGQLDLPQLALTQLFEGELFGNIYNNVFAPERLAPKERTKYTDYIKAAVNDSRNPFVDWVIDTVTDPLILISVGLTPGAAKGIVKGGIMTPINSNFVREKAPWLASIGLLTNQQSLRNAPQLMEAVLGVRHAKKEMLESSTQILQPAKDKLLKQLKKVNPRVKHLDPQKHAVGSSERKLVQEVMDAVHGRLSGLDQTARWTARTYTRGALVRNYRINPTTGGEAERVLLSTEELTEKQAKKIVDGWRSGRGLDEGEMFSEGRKVWTDDNGVKYFTDVTYTGHTPQSIQIVEKPLMSKTYVDDVINKYGLEEYITAHREVLDGTFMKLFGKERLLNDMRWSASEALEAFRSGRIKISDIVDEDKVFRLYRSRGLKASGMDEGASQAEEFLKGFFQVDTSDILKSVKSREQLVEEIQHIFSGQLQRRNYFPTSATQLLDEAGRPVRTFKSRVGKQDGTVVTPMGAVLQRTHGTRGSYGMDFYERMEEAASAVSGSEGEALLKEIGRKKERLAEKVEEAYSTGRARELGGVSSVNPNIERTMQKYLNQASNTYGLHIAGINRVGGKLVYDKNFWQFISDGQKKFKEGLDLKDVEVQIFDDVDELFYESMNFDGAKPNLGTIMAEASENIPLGGFSMADVLEQSYVGARLGNEFDAATIKDVLIPAMLGRKSLNATTENSLMMYLKKSADAFTKSTLGEHIKKEGGEFGKKIMDDMSAWSNPENLGLTKGALTGGVTKYLYSTHLGFNPASVMLNLTQPLLFTASFVGWRDTLKAYSQAFKELSQYAKNRKEAYGLNPLITPQERQNLITKSFRHAKNIMQDILGINPDIYENLDALTEMGKAAHPKALEYSFLGLPLKAFEKGEWFNRLVTSHAVENAYKRASRKGFFPVSAIEEGGELHSQMVRDQRAIVSETQFGSGVLNTPIVFMEQFATMPKAAGASAMAQGASHFLSNPLIRQFLQFPTRALTSAVFTPSQISGGVRTAFGKEMSLGPVGAATFDIMRGLGLSALISHSASDLMGIELERGLYPDAALAIPKMVKGTIAGEEYERFNPPVIDLARHGIHFLSAGDKASLQQFVPRLFPGGITLQRVLGVSRDQSGSVLGDLANKFQKTYVDWDNPTSDGHVPMFKGDGTLVGYEEPLGLILSGLGLDMGSLKKEQSEMAHYLNSQREELISRRREYLNALFANNIPKTKEISEDYENKFGIPLTVTKQQVDSYSKAKVISRDERILDRMPTDARNMYAKLVASRSERTGIPSGAFEKPTATKRSEVAQRPELNLDPAVLKALQRMVEEENIRKGKKGPFDPYRPPFLGE